MEKQNTKKILKLFLLAFTSILVSFEFYWASYLLFELSSQNKALEIIQSKPREKKTVFVSLEKGIFGIIKSGANSFRVLTTSDIVPTSKYFNEVKTWLKSTEGRSAVESMGWEVENWNKLKVTGGTKVDYVNFSADTPIFEGTTGSKYSLQSFPDLEAEKKVSSSFLRPLAQGESATQAPPESSVALANWWREKFPQVNEETGTLNNYLAGSSTPSILAQSEGTLKVLDPVALKESGQIKILKEIELTPEARQALADYNRTIGDIDTIFLPGGATNAPPASVRGGGYIYSSIDELPIEAQGAFNRDVRSLVIDRRDPYMSGQMNVIEATVNGNKVYVVDPMDALVYKTLTAPTSTEFTKDAEKFSYDFDRLYNIAKQIYGEDAIYPAIKDVFSNYIDQSSSASAELLKNRLGRLSNSSNVTSEGLKETLGRLNTDPEIIEKISSNNRLISPGDAVASAALSAVIPAVSWDNKIPLLAESENEQIQSLKQGSDSYKFDPNSGKVTQTDADGNTREIYSEWGSPGIDYTPEAAKGFSEAQMQKYQDLATSPQESSPLFSIGGYDTVKLTESINDIAMMTPATLGVGTALLGGSTALAELSPALIAANTAIIAPTTIVAGALAWGKVGYDLYQNPDFFQFVKQDLNDAGKSLLNGVSNWLKNPTAIDPTGQSPEATVPGQANDFPTDDPGSFRSASIEQNTTSKVTNFNEAAENYKKTEQEYNQAINDYNSGNLSESKLNDAKESFREAANQYYNESNKYDANTKITEAYNNGQIKAEEAIELQDQIANNTLTSGQVDAALANIQQQKTSPGETTPFSTSEKDEKVNASSQNPIIPNESVDNTPELELVPDPDYSLSSLTASEKASAVPVTLSEDDPDPELELVPDPIEPYEGLTGLETGLGPFGGNIIEDTAKKVSETYSSIKEYFWPSTSPVETPKTEEQSPSQATQTDSPQPGEQIAGAESGWNTPAGSSGSQDSTNSENDWWQQTEELFGGNLDNYGQRYSPDGTDRTAILSPEEVKELGNYWDEVGNQLAYPISKSTITPETSSTNNSPLPPIQNNPISETPSYPTESTSSYSNYLNGNGTGESPFALNDSQESTNLLRRIFDVDPETGEIKLKDGWENDPALKGANGNYKFDKNQILDAHGITDSKDREKFKDSKTTLPDGTKIQENKTNRTYTTDENPDKQNPSETSNDVNLEDITIKK